ncbi:glycoside hydrolase family 3 C-terminal domain-containing protein [Actinomadura sp. DC4]|uniref:glycoside hydrolase family 3 C-terminal domain-containing protein n=1 Tax=Actinomadura sp. DC4 TaxID=3055069 RepID=UPI0025B23140|nr:glycoside hydrolase family 3 C-terminal domain-containing protein [Actinomadura sp. DC4]MDN3351377.1 glycoside hydrolase family 3 C-terminal domain-containing protein [Actinomadura sp. DC4]
MPTTAHAAAALVLTLAGLTAAGPARAADTGCSAWMDTRLSPGHRADLVLARLTLEEKAGMMHAISDSTHDREVPPVPRLCVPALLLNNGPAGVGSSGPVQAQTTAMPAPLGLAASFDPSMARAYGVVEGRETRDTGRNLMEGPDINIARTPLNGRTFEAYGEDPYLAGRIAAGNIDGIQSQGVIADAKHYLANNQEVNRDTVDEHIDERTLHEIYLPAFEESAKRSGSIMCSKNKVNGAYACEHQDLLNGVLKNDWGYQGFVVSDFGSCHDTVRCATGGLDLELPSGAHYGDPLIAAVRSGQVPIATVDEHVHRILTTMFRFGLFDRTETTTPIDARRDGAVSRAAAEAGTVLLKNAGGVLPLRKDREVALIGPGAGTAVATGGGSSGVAPLYKVSPLGAFRKRGVKVTYAEGMPPVDLGPQPALPSYAVTAENGAHGWTARYYANTTWSGDPTLTRVDPWIDTDPTGGIPAPGLPPNGWSVRWSGTFAAPVDGDYTFNLTNHAHATLYLDGRSVLDNGGGFPGVTRSVTVHLTAGQPHPIRVDWAKPAGQAMIELSWAPPANAPDVQIEEAVAAAKRADTAVVFVANKDTEAIDRTGLALPGHQDRLVEAVAAANPRTVVVLNTGGPVLMPWAGEVAGVVQAWYPGEEDGNAAADVLLGDADPSGRLPITFPRSLADTPASTPEQYPGVGGVATYSEGLRVGYRHYDEKNIEPLYPFGYGLSYTTFAYRHLTVRRHGGDVTVGADVTNTGRRTGTAVPQLYVGAPDEPPAQLKGFTKVRLAPGRTRHVTFHLTPRSFASWDTSAHAWRVAGGRYLVMLGAGSRDIRSRQALTLPATACPGIARSLVMTICFGGN